MKRGGRWESCVWLIVFDFGWINENWWNQFKCSAKRERTPTNTHHTNAFLHWWKKRAESEWNPINGVKGRGRAGMDWIWGWLWAAQPHGNKPKEKTSPARYSSFLSLFSPFDWMNLWMKSNWEKRRAAQPTNEWDCFSCLLLPLWVKGGSCRTAPHKRESNQTKQTKWTMNEAKIKVKWTNQLTWVICLCGIEEFMNQWSKTKSESIEFVNGARGPPPKGAQQTINWREWMKRNGVEWNEIHLNWIVAARLWAGGHLFFHFTPLIKQIKKKRKV